MYSWAIALSLSALITSPSWLVYLTYHRQCQWCNFSAFRKVPALRAAFITLRNLRFSQSILVTAVCVCVCVRVCLSVCPSSKALQAVPIVRSSWFYLQKMSSGHATMQHFFFWKSDEGQGQGHHFCEKQIMGHNFWTGSDRDFGLVAKRSLYNSASVRYPPFWRTPSRFYVTWL